MIPCCFCRWVSLVPGPLWGVGMSRHGYVQEVGMSRSGVGMSTEGVGTHPTHRDTVGCVSTWAAHILLEYFLVDLIRVVLFNIMKSVKILMD